MLTLYKAPRSERGSSSSSDESSSSRMTIPAGRPYITKVNGKLVMARDKREKNADVALDLLGEVFGSNPRTRIIRKRSKSINEPKGPLLINGTPYVQQLAAPMPPNTTPIPQQGFTAFPPPVIPPQYPLPYPPQPSPIYPPQYPQPYYRGQVPTFLIQPPPLQPQYQPQSQPQSKPTKEDLDQLVKMDSHFNKKVDKDGKSVDPLGAQNDSENAISTKTTVMIVKHVCAHCGRLRSRKYHHEHPIKDGEIPAPAFCRKCQRDSSSTSESSGSGREERRKGKKDTKKKKAQGKKHKKKVVVSSSEDESPKKDNNQSSKPKSGPGKKKEDIPFDPKEDYIVVEEELSAEDRKPRGRRREKIVVEEYDGPSRPLSPLDPRSYPRRAHSAAERQNEAPRKPMRLPKHRHTEQSRQRSPSTEYTRVEAPNKRYNNDHEDVVYPKQVPIHFVDEVKYDKPVTVSSGYHKEDEEDIYPKKIPVRYVERSVAYGNSSKPGGPYRKDEGIRTRPVQYVEEVVYMRPAASSTVSHHSYRDRQHSGQARRREYTTDEVETFSRGLASLGSTIGGRSDSIRDHPRSDHASQRQGSHDSSRSSELRCRRRRGNATPTKAWEAPYPAEEDEVVVVTERYESRRPQQQPHDEAERRRQEYVDKTTFSARDQSLRFAREDAARYFQEDWERVDQATLKQQRPGSSADTRERPRKPSLAESYDYTISRIGCEIPVPKVPTPPPPPPEFTYYSELENFDVLDNSWCNGTWEKEHPGKTRERERSTSRPRSAHVRNELDEKALIPSPAISRVHSREHIVSVHEDEVSLSSMSERERLAELGARHVTFRDTPSMKSAAAWSGSEKDPSPSRKDRNGKKAKKEDGGGGGWDGAGSG